MSSPTCHRRRSEASTSPSWPCPCSAALVLVIVVAVLASAGEFQHRTIRTTLLAVPPKGQVLVGKAAAAATYGAAVTALGVLAGTASGWITASIEGATVETGSTTSWLAVVGAVVVGAIWAIVTTAIGILSTSTALAITVLLLWRFRAWSWSRAGSTRRTGSWPRTPSMKRCTVWAPCWTAAPESCTENIPLSGAEGYEALWNSRHELAACSGLHEVWIDHLLHRYGSLISELLDLTAADPSLGEPLSGADYLRVEVVYAASHEVPGIWTTS